MLGNRLSTAPSGLAPVALYSDMLTAGGSFSTRQWFSSGTSVGDSNSIAYGNGEVRIFSGASGRHCLCHFDCMKDQYPTYSASKTYNVGDIVYGGFAGHGLYQKTASSSAGFSPTYTSATDVQDANGWTRYRPTPRQIVQGGTLSISLKLKLDRTGYTITSNNAIRIGLFESVGSYINYDNHGLSNAVFNGYSGYMFGYGPADNRILKRTETANPPLISTTTGVYTPLSTWSVGGFGVQNEYDVSIKLKRIGSSLEITSHIYGSGYSSKFTHIDATPFTSFDTLAFYTVSNNVASMAVSNPIATYDGGSVALQSGGCSDLDARVWMYGVNEFWSFGPRTLTRVADRHYTFGDEVVKHNGTAWEYYYERLDTGKVLIETAGGNEAWPWLVPWLEFTSQKLCLPPVYPAYNGGATYSIGDRVSHGGGNFVCIYNAGSSGYGPFGGYLDGTANGIIYWLPE